ncbi:hypothetical protein [Pseudomonas iridis]|uniref:hypothetical protein n=1 Tax=Pseudomonas iridis TaxID=2710587 RepID=UPI0021C009F3|nr:hypothetical protein [Pseudomonas iridis]MCT8945612.1 hypothetical protein [Pseudomonas iridis]
MSGKTVEITLSGGEVVSFDDTEYSLHIPAAELITGADGQQAYVLKVGEFSIRTPEFEGWYSAEGVTVEGVFYEVQRNFKTPARAGEWLVYPVGQ